MRDAKPPLGQEPFTPAEGKDSWAAEEPVDALPVSPGLLFAGLLALGVGVAAGLVMSAVSLFR